MNSFSQGIFTFSHGLHGTKTKEKKSAKFPIPKTTFEFGKNSRLWNTEFERTWNLVQTKVDEFQANNNDNHLVDLFDFVAKSYTKDNSAENDVSGISFLRVAALLTGINKPDHYQHFKLLSNKMSKRNIAKSVFLPARDCPNVRVAMETLVSCLLSDGRKHNYQNEDDESLVANHNNSFSGNEATDTNDEDSEDDEPPIKLRRSQYTLSVLQSWYNEKYSKRSFDERPKLAVIMPNFEEFKPSVIKDLILILSNHCEQLPFVVILGVATSTVSVLNTLSFTETSRIKLRAFSSQPPNQFLEKVLNEIILTPKFPFQLASNVFDYLKGVFIFYDLTIKNFLKAMHHCLLEHYLHGNAYALCANTFELALENIAHLKHNDLETIRRLPSFRPYVEAMTDDNGVIDIFEKDEYFREVLEQLVFDYYSHVLRFHGYVRALFNLVKNLPQTPLGRRLSDIYSFCHSTPNCVTTTEDFQNCWQLLALMSKDEFITSLENVSTTLKEYSEEYCDEEDIDEQMRDRIKRSFKKTNKKLRHFIDELQNDQRTESEETATQKYGPQVFESRQSFYRNLLERNQTKTESKEIMTKVLDFLRVDFEKYLIPYKRMPLHELFVYSDCDAVRSHLRGTSRSAIHSALTDPNCYLQCNCCEIGENANALLPTMPDISVAYKLLLEAGQQVNIYDWMVAFNTVVGDPNDESDDIPPVIQAKFTRGRAELQFLGFTKSSKRKTDHVTRTTW